MRSWKGWTVDLFGFFKEHRAWAGLIALINFVGIAYGFYYYEAQFTVTPPSWWWLVPDSPLAVLWAELALAAYWFLPARTRGRWLWLDALAFVGNVQVGLWTCYVLLAYEGHFHTLDFLQGEGPIALNSILWIGHLGMAVLALIFVKGFREARQRTPRAALAAVGIAGAYYLVNDIVDYFGPTFLVSSRVGPIERCVDQGLRPYTIPCTDQESILALVTFGLTLGALALFWWLSTPPAVAKNDV